MPSENREAIARMLKEQVEKGVGALRNRFTKAESGKPHSKETENDVDRILANIAKLVDEQWDEVNWQDATSINKLCAELDKIIEQQRPRFIRSQKRISRTSPHDRWEAFIQAIQKHRLNTRQAIQDEIARIAKAAAQAEWEATHSASTDNSETADTTSGQTQDPEKIETKTILPEVKKVNPDEILPVAGKLALDAGLPEQIATDLGDLGEAINMGDPELAAEFLEKIIIHLKQLNTDVNTALEEYNEYVERGVSPEKIEELEISLATSEKDAANARESLVQMENQISELTQELTVTKQTLEMRAAAHDSLVQQLITEADAAHHKEKEFSKKEKLTAEQVHMLQDQLAEVQNALFGSQRVIELLKTQQREDQIEISRLKQLNVEQQKKVDFTEIKTKIKTEIRALQTHKEELEEIFMEIVQWAKELEGQKTDEFDPAFKMALVVAPDEDRAGLKQIEKDLNKQIASYGEKAESIRATIDKLDIRMANLKKYLELLADTETASTTSLSNVERVNLPDIDSIIRQAVEKLSSPDSTPVAKVAAPDKTESPKPELDKLTELPYTVEFTAEDARRIAQYEQQIVVFRGKSIDRIKAQLPLDPNDTKREYYERLVQHLHSGEFLPMLEMVVVVLGALRDGDKFKSRVSNTVFNSMYRREVGLCKSTEDTKTVAGILIEAAMLGKMIPELQLINRIKTYKLGPGNKFPNPANELTPLGQVASQVWTKEMMKEKVITAEQLTIIHRNAPGQNNERE